MNSAHGYSEGSDDEYYYLKPIEPKNKPMSDNEKKIVQLEIELSELKGVLSDAVEVGRLTQLAYNELLYATGQKVPASINSKLNQWRGECAVLTRRVNTYVDKINHS